MLELKLEERKVMKFQSISQKENKRKFSYFFLYSNISPCSQRWSISRDGILDLIEFFCSWLVYGLIRNQNLLKFNFLYFLAFW